MSKEEKINNEQTGFEISDEVIDQLLKNYRKPEDLLASEGIIKQLTKRAIERIMNAEMDYRLDSEENTESGREAGNCRSGKGHKIIKGDFGEVAIETPRDRKSTFEPRIVPKRQHRVEIIDKAIMALYAKGMTARDI